jgi:hypothetical protein
MERIKFVFDRDFSQWRIELPSESLEYQLRGEIKAEGWLIYYVFGENSKGSFMDYLAWHHMEGEPRHKRIYASGEEEYLPTYIGFIVYPANTTKADRERIEQAYYRYNRQVGKLLEMKGFSPPDRWEGEENMQFEANTGKEFDRFLRLIDRVRNRNEK